MHDVKLRCHVRCYRWRAVALAGVMATSDVADSHLARIVRLRLRDLSSNEYISSRSNRRFKIALRTARAPRYFFNSIPRRFYAGYLSI